MNGARLITMLTAVLLTALCVVSCRSTKEVQPDSEITVSLYIPGAVMTRAETGFVDPTAAESIFKTLDIWVFLSEKENDEDVLVCYHHYDAKLDLTGLPYNTVTRFGMKLEPEMFTKLTKETDTKVDVYAVMNAASAISTVPGDNATRDMLEQLIINGFGNSPLVMSVDPEVGLPMSGVLKGADVSGGYPVLNISNTLWLTRAVSKIRFVFSQQGNPDPDNPDTLIPVKSGCEIVRISFDGKNKEDEGKDCQIATREKLFTTQSFDIVAGEYTPLDATLTGENGSSLIINDNLSILDNPEELFYQVMESAEHYETRLNNAIDARSQVGPIYLRETDKTISGTIYYRISEDDQDLREADFSMKTGDVFSRNHSWIVYACFTEETLSLQLTVKVLPWDYWDNWEQNPIDFTAGTVNVIKRFTVTETNPPSFSKEEVKVQGSYGFFDVKFWHTLTTDPEEGPQNNVLKGDIIIATPIGAKLYLAPVPNSLVVDGFGKKVVITDAIKVYFTDLPDKNQNWHYIYANTTNPDNKKVEFCKIPIAIECNSKYKDLTDLTELDGQYIDLHFYVEIGNGIRYIDLGSESIDYYRFILTQDWDKDSNSNSNENNGNE